MSTIDVPSQRSGDPACLASLDRPVGKPELCEPRGADHLNPNHSQGPEMLSSSVVSLSKKQSLPSKGSQIDELKLSQSLGGSLPSEPYSSDKAAPIEKPDSKPSPDPQAKKPKPIRNGPRYRKADAEGRLGLTHRHPDFVLPDLPTSVHPKNSDFLEEDSGRKVCPQCKSSRSLFCHECLLVLTDRSKVPTVTLPFHIHILLHGEERRSAATGVHAALLSPGQVTIYPGNSFPRAFDPAVTAVLYPSETSVPVSELSMDRLEHVLLIDSKWKKAKSLIEDPLLKGLPHVRLEPVKTAFWRYHTKNVTDEGVSTIEAIYYLCKQRHKTAHDGDSSQCHCYDDLLFYFAHIYRRILKTGSVSSAVG